MKEFVIQWRKFELKRSYINEFMNFLIFQDFLDFILIFQDLFNRVRSAEVTWRNRTVGIKSHNRMVGIKLCNQTVGSKSRNWTVRIESRNRTVGIKSRNWTAGIKSRDWTAEITRSGIRVMGHDPTNFVHHFVLSNG